MNTDNIFPGFEEAVGAMRPVAEESATSAPTPEKSAQPKRKAKPTPAADQATDLGAELTALHALKNAEAQLKRCEVIFNDCGAEMANGTSKVLRGAVHLAFVGRHDLWQLAKGADGKPLHGGLTDYAKAYLKGIGCGCSPTRVSRLAQEGNLGLDLHAAGLVLPATAEPLRTVIDAKLKDAIDVCRQLIAAHQGVFPDSGETAAFLATLPKKKTEKKKSAKKGWRERVTGWSDEGKGLARARAPYEEIEAVFEKIRVYASPPKAKGKGEKTHADKAA